MRKAKNAPVTLRIAEETNSMLKLMALQQGVSRSEVAEKSLRSLYAVMHPLLVLFARGSHLEEEMDIPGMPAEFADIERPSWIIAEEEALRKHLDMVEEAEDVWKDTASPEDTQKFIEALRRGEISVVDGKIAMPRKGRATKAFPEVDLGTRTWVHNLESRSHLDSLNMPMDLLAECAIRDKSYGVFSMTDLKTGKLIAIQERFRISSGRELVIPVKIQQRLKGVRILKVQYHGPAA